MKKTYAVSDGQLLLNLTPAQEGGFTVTCPLHPELVTEAETVEEAFAMAKDGLKALNISRVKLLKKIASARQA